MHDYCPNSLHLSGVVEACMGVLLAPPRGDMDKSLRSFRTRWIRCSGPDVESPNGNANWNGGKEKLRTEEIEESRRQESSGNWSTATEGFLLRCNCGSNGKPNSASPAYAEIVVIGHGETEWNADGRILVHFSFE
ncbi:hypothetical protein LguiA_017511 [Lonicera macranthoides]